MSQFLKFFFNLQLTELTYLESVDTESLLYTYTVVMQLFRRKNIWNAPFHLESTSGIWMSLTIDLNFNFSLIGAKVEL